MNKYEILDILERIARPWEDDPYEESEILLMRVMDITEDLIKKINEDGVTK